MLTIIAQLGVLAVIFLGWGYWAARVLPLDKRDGFSFPFHAVAGFAVAVILVQDLVYLGVRIFYSAWGVLLVALAGVVMLVRSSGLKGIFSLRRRGVAALFLPAVVVGAIHGIPLFYHGAENYYGSAHADHANYVLMAQFLVDEPFGTPDGAIGLHPWMKIPIEVKNQRIGVSVCEGIVAVLSGTDAKAAYGVTSVSLLMLLASFSFALLRRFSVNTVTAVLASAWIGLLPALTKAYLDGFFAQTAVLFVFPALGALLIRRKELTTASVALAGVLCALVLSFYTEMYVLALATAITLVLVQAKSPLFRRVWQAGIIVLLPICLLPGYLAAATAYLRGQYGAAADPNALASLMPHSGSLQGWGGIFAQPGPLQARFGMSLYAVLGSVAIIAGLSAFFSASRKRRLQLMSLSAVPCGALLVLLSRTEFPKYPFGKLAISFSWLWCTLIVLGLARLVALCRRRRWVWTGASIAIAAFLVLACSGTLHQVGAILRDDLILRTVDSKGAREAYAFAEKHPDLTYVVREEQGIANAWLCYHARRSNVYLDAAGINDRRVPAGSYEFRNVPADVSRYILMSASGYRDPSTYAGPPDITVRNPQGSDSDGTVTFYWVGDFADLQITRFGRSPQPAPYVLTFVAMPGPANPRPDRIVALIQEGASVTKLKFDGVARLTAPVLLRPGRNDVRIEVVEPKQQTVVVPGDPRKHMVRIQELGVKPGRS